MNKSKLIFLLLALTSWFEIAAAQPGRSGIALDAIPATQQSESNADFPESSSPANSTVTPPSVIFPKYKSGSDAPKPTAKPDGNVTTVPPGRIVVSVIKTNHGLIEIHSSERIKKYNVYTLTSPSRLVVEINNAVSRFGDSSVLIDKFGIAHAHFENNPKFLRIYFDSAQGRILPYRVEESNPSLNIFLKSPSR
jgi:hypothetical protein